MKKLKTILFCSISILVFNLSCNSQMVVIEPSDARPDDEIKIIFNANLGRGELIGASKVYMHSGLVTDSPTGTSWQHVIGNWGADDGIGEMTPVSGQPNKWEISLSPSARAYHQAPPGTNIFRISMVFRSADGSTKGTFAPGTYDWGFVATNEDIYVNLSMGPYITLISPLESELFLLENESFPIKASASESATVMEIWAKENGSFEKQHELAAIDEIEFQYTPSGSGEIEIKVVATIDGAEVETTKLINVILRNASEIESLPVGLLKGINYHQEDPSKVTLVLEAPGKEFVYVTGDFTNWEINNDFMMKKAPTEGFFWLEIIDLEPQKEYVFQYWVDGTIKIGDPYAEKVADPWNDPYIPASLYPGLPTYSLTSYGVASILQTGQTRYEWKAIEDEWIKPPKENLVIYEILIRDFLGTHSYKELADTLTYLKKLGINAIELMPIMEFEGNDSWGYNPSYFFAPDKYYGTREDLKNLIETAHKLGMAVILDMVLNHAFGQNALVKMYWDAEQNTVSEESPWFNPVPKHPYNVGFDFNHESLYTQQFVDSVNHFWLHEYHFDGFRFDLSKGFTQQDNLNSVSGWSEYDASRIALLKRMADKIWSHSPDAYVILEHFAANSEEKELAEYRSDEGKGMLIWGNLNHAYNQSTMGYVSGSNISGVYHETRNWNFAHLIGYMESHDEDRLMYRNREFGNISGNYSVKNVNTALERTKAAGVLFYTIPGPKMIWQFGEAGYEYSINRCPDGSINDNCRLSVKPHGWNLLNESERLKLFNHTADLLRLRNEFDVFTKGIATFAGNNALVKQVTLENQPYTSNPTSSDDMNVKLVSNFELTAQNISVAFPHAGTWYDYYDGSKPIEIGSPNYTLTLAPGQYKLYTDYPIEAPVVTNIAPIVSGTIKLYPNPAEHTFWLETGYDAIQDLYVSNLLGNRLSVDRLHNNQWDISSLRPGLYIIHMKIAGKTHFMKLLKE